MEVPLSGKELVGVEYPGTVINVDKMMEQFHGEKKVYETLSDPAKRLELYFRPRDPFSKPAYGDKFPTKSLVIEVIRRRKKRREHTEKESPKETLEIKCLGFVYNIYKFKAVCDYQMPPVHYKETGETESLLSKLVPSGLPSASWLEEDVPAFMVPLMFSRFDSAQSFYTEGVKQTKSASEDVFNPAIGTSRKKRTSYAVYRTFDSQESVDGPSPQILEILQLQPLQLSLKHRIEQLYEERPIWSKAALVSKLHLDANHIRYSLTATAYRFSNGPWRTLWVKFGYDPRKDPKSKIYQLMDFRVKPCIKLLNIDGMRVKNFDHYLLPMKSQKQTSKASLLKREHLLPDHSGSKDADLDSMNRTPSYILTDRQLPAMRQCYYQLCDIYIDEVQKLVHQNDGLEHFCHEKDGWCEPGVIEKCREVISKHIEAVSQQMQAKTS